jgi:hypothetical protein
VPSAISSIATAFAVAVLAGPSAARAQEPRADLTGPFVHLGGVAGSVTRDSGPVDENHSGYGWGAGAGINLTSWFSVVADYTIFRVTDATSQKYNLSQSAVGLRLRVGGDQTPVVFYVEGGAGVRSATLSTGGVFGNAPPANAGTAVQLDGWSGWFGPGVQFYVFGPRVPLEVSVVWAWGTLNHAHIDGATTTLADPIGITTLRMRIGFAAMLF